MPDSLIADRLRSLKEERGITNLDLARALGVTQPTVSRWVSGKIIPPRDQLEAIAGYFSVPVAYICGFVDDESASISVVLTAINAAKAAREELDRAISALEKIGLADTVRPSRLYLAADGGKINGPDRVAESLDKNTAYTVDGEEYGKGTDMGDSGQPGRQSGH